MSPRISVPLSTYSMINGRDQMNKIKINLSLESICVWSYPRSTRKLDLSFENGGVLEWFHLMKFPEIYAWALSESQREVLSFWVENINILSTFSFLNFYISLHSLSSGTNVCFKARILYLDTEMKKRSFFLKLSLSFNSSTVLTPSKSTAVTQI